MRRRAERAKSKRAKPQPVAARLGTRADGQREAVTHAFLDSETLKFIQSDDVAIYVAAADASCRPHAARAFGCRVSRSPYSLTTWVSCSAAAAVLDDIAQNGRLAFTVSHIPSCRTLQLKSLDAEIVEVTSADFARVAAYQDGYVRATAAIGYPEAVMRSTIQVRLDDLAALRFVPMGVFKQTPGAGAGAPLVQASETAGRAD